MTRRCSTHTRKVTVENNRAQTSTANSRKMPLTAPACTVVYQRACEEYVYSSNNTQPLASQHPACAATQTSLYYCITYCCCCCNTAIASGGGGVQLIPADCLHSVHLHCLPVYPSAWLPCSIPFSLFSWQERARALAEAWLRRV